MKTLSLNITQDEAYSFFEHYDKLSPLRKNIWKMTVWWVKRFPVAKPKQSTIAQKVGCCRQAVSEAFKIFKDLGWLYLISRGYKKSKILGIPTHLTMIDVTNREYFKRVEATYRATYSYSRYKNTTSTAGEIKILQPSPLGTKLGMSFNDSLKLSLFSEHIQQEALSKAKFLGKNGWRPNNEHKYFLGICATLSNKMGIKPNWRSYYVSAK